VHRLLWLGQLVFGVYFVAIGILHLVMPADLPAQMAWMYDLSTTVHVIVGTAEILGGLGLVLPGLTGIRPELTPLAAACLAVVMVAATVWHVPREEWTQVGITVLDGTLLALIAYGRWRLRPLSPRNGRPTSSRREPEFL
jgi:uncharacterized membrane protein YphA (DoxX/SURF4 family)